MAKESAPPLAEGLAPGATMPPLWYIHIILLTGMIAGSSASVLARIAQQEHVPTPVIIAFRMTLGALALTPFVLRSYRSEISRLSRRGFLFAVVAGFWFAVHLLASFASLEYTTILVSNILAGTAPLWIAVIETSFLNARLSGMVWWGLAFTLVGGAVIALSGGAEVHFGNNPALGMGLAVFAAVTAAFYSLIGRGSRHSIPFLPYLWLVFISGSLVTLIVVLLLHAPVLGYSDKAYLALLLLTILPQLIAHSAINYSLRRLSATHVSVMGQLVTIGSVILAFLFFHEVPVPIQIPGSVAVIVGVILVNLGKTKLE